MKIEEITTKGKLNYFEHVWNEGIFDHTDLHILEQTETGTSSSVQYFYAQVPYEIIGKEVILYQDQKKKSLFQRLTTGNEEEGNLFQIRATSKNK